MLDNPKIIKIIIAYILVSLGIDGYDTSTHAKNSTVLAEKFSQMDRRIERIESYLLNGKK